MNYEGLKPEGAVVSNNNGALSSRRSTEQDETLTVASLPEEAKQRKSKKQLVTSQHRLDDIVRQGFSAIDYCVYDTPIPPLGMRKKSRVDGGEPYYMSGALLTDPSLSQAEGSRYAVGSVDCANKDPLASKPLLITPSTSSHESMQPSGSALPAFHRKPKIMSGSINESSTEKSSLYQAEPYNHQLQVNHDPNHYMPSRSHHVLALSSPFGNTSDGMTVEHWGSSQNGTRTSSVEDRPCSSRRETPVPAPQPWRGLGMENPFSSNPFICDPFRTPTKRSWSHRLESLTNGKPQMEQDTPNSPTPQGNVLSGPDSSPLNKFLHPFVNNKKKHERKSKKHQGH